MPQYMRAAGDLSEEEAERVRATALFGVVDECFVFAALSDIPSIQTKRLEYLPGEVLLLASDGLHRRLTYEEIHASVKPLELAESVRNPAKLCLERGGEDDVSLILLSIDEGLQK